VGIYSRKVSELRSVQSSLCAEALTHRRKIQMLRRNARELTTVRTSLADAMAASQISKLGRAGVGVLVRNALDL
jgi:hypothetical protein